MRRAGGQNQEVVGQLTVAEDQRAPWEINPLDLRQQHFDIFLMTEDPANR